MIKKILITLVAAFLTMAATAVSEETFYHYGRNLKPQGYTKIDKSGTQRHYNNSGRYQGMSKPRYSTKSPTIQRGKK